MRVRSQLQNRADEATELRAYALRLTEERRVTSVSEAASFVNEVGLARLLTNGADGFPSLYAAVCGRPTPNRPRHTHHDEEISLAWELKDSLIELGLVYYAKLIAKQPTFAVPELVPVLGRLYAHRPGELSEAARAVYRALRRRSPQTTHELKAATRLSERKVFDAAVEELQTAMLVIPVEVRYEPAFTYVWGLAVERFPQLKEKPPREPVVELLRWHLRAVRQASALELSRRFRLPLEAISNALLALSTAGEVSLDESRNGLIAVASPLQLPLREVSLESGWD